MVFCVFIFICFFLFKTSVRKGHLDKSNSATAMIIYLKVLFRKLLDHS